MAEPVGGRCPPVLSVLRDVSQVPPTEGRRELLLCSPRARGAGGRMDELDHQGPGFVLFVGREWRGAQRCPEWPCPCVGAEGPARSLPSPPQGRLLRDGGGVRGREEDLQAQRSRGGCQHRGSPGRLSQSQVSCIGDLWPQVIGLLVTHLGPPALGMKPMSPHSVLRGVQTDVGEPVGPPSAGEVRSPPGRRPPGLCLLCPLPPSWPWTQPAHTVTRLPRHTCTQRP